MLSNVLEIAEAKMCVDLVAQFASSLSLLEDRPSAASSKLSTSTSVTVQDLLRNKLEKKKHVKLEEERLKQQAASAPAVDEAGIDDLVAEFDLMYDKKGAAKGGGGRGWKKGRKKK